MGEIELGSGERLVVSVQYPPKERQLFEVEPPTAERANDVAAYQRAIAAEGGSYIEVCITTVGPDDHDSIVSPPM